MYVYYSIRNGQERISLAAVGMGISSLERHITIDRTIYGSDQAASLEPNGFRNLVNSCNKILDTLGDGQKKLLDEELPISKKLREHLDYI